MEKKTDIELVARARAGDKQAFDQLVERYQPLAQRVALSMVANAEIARDLAQEAMLQAYLSLGHLKDDGRFQNWLHGITRNVCRGYLRDLKTDWLSLEALTGGMLLDVVRLSDAAIDPHSALEARERRQAVSAAMDALSVRDQAVARLFYDEQLSLKEIAAAVGISVRAVKNRLYRARKQLRERLLPVYPEVARPAGLERRRNLVKVIIDRVYSEPPVGGNAAVVLRDEAGSRTLHVAMTAPDAAAIDRGLRRLTLPRPMTFSFMAGLMEAAGARLEEVRIEALKHGILYAVAKLRRGKTVRELDARPSDALALAVHTGSPIYVAEELLGQTGMDSPHDLQQGEELAPSETPIPELLPVLPMRDAVYFPRTLFPVFVGREKSLRALDEAQAKDRYVLVIAQKQESVVDPQPEDIYRIGTVCRLVQLLQLPDHQIRVILEGVARARVLEYRQTEPFRLARVQVLPEEEDTSVEAQALVESFLERYQEVVEQGKAAGFAPPLPGVKEQGPGCLADSIASGISLPIETRQELLETANPRERLEKLSGYLVPVAEPTSQGVMPKEGLWQRFTERARRVTYLAQEEAARLGEIYVGTEHLLLGLTRVPDSVGAQILVRLGIALESVENETRKQVTRGTADMGQAMMQLTPGAKKAIDLAYEEARLLHNNYIGVEHLLLGLIREGEGLAAKVLVKLGADLGRTRRELQSMQAK